MDKIRIAFFVAQNNFKKWLVNPRMYIVVIMMAMYIQSRLAPITEFCSAFGYKVTPYIFPFLMTDKMSVMLIMFTLVLLFCDAPFIESEQPYIITRSGRKTWVAGQIIYIALASALFFLIIILFTVLFLIPHIEFSGEWGKVIGTFAQTSVGANHMISIPFDLGVYSSYTPASAMLITFGLCCFVGMFLGMTIFFFNLNISRSAGAIIAAVLILWQVAVGKTSTVFINFSPVSWVSLTNIDVKGITLYPTIWYILTVLSILSFLLILGSVVSIRKRDIDVLKPV